MSKIILPPPLKPGDLLRVIAPSGALREFAAFEQSLEIWKAHGYNIQVSDNIESRHGYLAGTDDHRRQQLATAWHDPECRGNRESIPSAQSPGVILRVPRTYRRRAPTCCAVLRPSA